jgi:hypothetical protein
LNSGTRLPMLTSRTLDSHNQVHMGYSTGIGDHGRLSTWQVLSTPGN